MSDTAVAPRIPWLVLILAGIALFILLSLGTWQVKRLAWKEGLLATIHERMTSAPKPLAAVAAKPLASHTRLRLRRDLFASTAPKRDVLRASRFVV